jgi:hypothetical protein
VKLEKKDKAVGTVVGKLTLLQFIPGKFWSDYLVKCECGVEKKVRRGNLVNGTTTSCGSRVCTGQITHGMFSKQEWKNERRTPEYVTWDNIMRRANPKTLQSRRGRYANLFKKTPGISEEWKVFENFLADMGPKPSPKHSIDRIDNNKGYSKENCRWATHKEQSRNMSSNKHHTVLGEQLCLKDIYEKYNVERGCIKRRTDKGLSVQDAIFDIYNKRDRLK